MSITNRGSAALCLVAMAALSGCAGTEAATTESPAAVVAAIENSDVKKVTFTKEAVEAVGVATSAVTKDGPHGELTMPYDAVIYYLDGTTWAYTVTGEREYTRVPVTVTSIAGEQATLRAGPAAGTQVVVVGAPEVLGAELEIDGEQ
jgi:hypothetical protein